MRRRHKLPAASPSAPLPAARERRGRVSRFLALAAQRRIVKALTAPVAVPLVAVCVVAVCTALVVGTLIGAALTAQRSGWQEWGE